MNELLKECTSALLKAHKDYPSHYWTRIPTSQAVAMAQAVIDVCIKHSPADQVLAELDR